MIRPASAAALRELLRVIVAALDVPEDQPGRLLVISSGVWSALRVVIADDFSAEAVRWATATLRLAG